MSNQTWRRLLFHLEGLASSWDRVDAGLRFRIERWVVAFGIGIPVLAGYFILTVYNVQRYDLHGVPTLALWTLFDQRIPLVPEAFWTYILYFPLALMPAFLARERQHLVEMSMAYILVTSVAWATWVLVPVRMVYPDLDCAGLSCRMLGDIWASDGGVNVFPSLHVGHSVLVALIFWTYRHRVPLLVLAGVTAMALAVSASTVLLKQHYLVDVPAGALLAWAGWTMTRRFEPALAVQVARFREFAARLG